MTDAATIRTSAAHLRDMGLNVNLLGGDKHPIHKWKSTPDYTKAYQTDAEFADLPWDGYDYVRRDGVHMHADPPVGNAIISGPGDGRVLDLDKCTNPLLLARMVDAMGLDADYGWQYRSGSHRGYGVVVVCPDAIPDSLLDRFTGTTEKILVGTPRDGAAFKQLELRYTGCQTVVPPSLHPSGNTYEWLYGEPTPPPAKVTIDQLMAGFLAIAELPPPAPPKVEPKLVAKSIKLIDSESDATRIIQRVKDSQTCRDYLGAKPGKNAACPCPASHEGDAQISFGNTVCYCHSKNPGCLLAGVKGLDRWKLEVILEYGGDNRACLIAHGWQPPAKRATTYSGNKSGPSPTPEQRAERRQDAERKRDARKHEAAERRAAVEARVDADAELTASDRAVLNTLLLIAGERGWCRPSKERIAEMCGYSVGSVKRSLMRLETRGYFVSEGDGGGPNQTAIRTFLRGSSFATETTFVPKDDPRVDISSTDLDQSSVACEPPPSPAPERACEADDLDTWQWCDDGHGGGELSALDVCEPTTKNFLGRVLVSDLSSKSELIRSQTEPDAVQQAKVNRILAMTDAELAALVAEPCNVQLDVTTEPLVPDAAGVIARLFARKENEHGQVDRPGTDNGSVGGSGAGGDAAVQSAPTVEAEPGASYDSGGDWTAPGRHRRTPKEADAVKKAKRQARLRAMDAPELTREYWMLTNKAKHRDGREKETLLALAAEVKHYQELAYARRDEAAEATPRSQAQPTRGARSALSPPMLALFTPMGGGP